MMEAKRSPLENGKIFAHVSVKISCITTVPMKRPIRITLVQRFTISADLQSENKVYILSQTSYWVNSI